MTTMTTMTPFIENYVAERQMHLQYLIEHDKLCAKIAKAVAKANGESRRKPSDKTTLEIFVGRHELLAQHGHDFSADEMVGYYLNSAVLPVLSQKGRVSGSQTDSSHTFTFSKDYFTKTLHLDNPVKLTKQDFDSAVAKALPFLQQHPVYIPCDDISMSGVEPKHLSGTTMLLNIRAIFALPVANSNDVAVMCVWSPNGQPTVVGFAAWLLIKMEMLIKAVPAEGTQFTTTVLTASHLLASLVGDHLDETDKLKCAA